MLTTTLTLLRQKKACADGYKRLLHHLGGAKLHGANTPIPLTVVLDSNGLADAVWYLRAVPLDEIEQRDQLARLFACGCAERVLANYEALYPSDKRPRDCINTAKRFALGTATVEERNAAWSAAESAARSAAWSVAESTVWSAAWTAVWSAAESAAWSAAWSAAQSAAGAAAWSAAWSAAQSAAASAAERLWQAARLRDYLEATLGQT